MLYRTKTEFKRKLTIPPASHAEAYSFSAKTAEDSRYSKARDALLQSQNPYIKPLARLKKARAEVLKVFRNWVNERYCLWVLQK